jgi:hypothetical protein
MAPVLGFTWVSSSSRPTSERAVGKASWKLSTRKNKSNPLPGFRNRSRPALRSIHLQMVRIASPKNVAEDPTVVARDRSGPIYCVSIAASSPGASSADDLPKTIRRAISRRHSFRRRCSVRS